MSNVREWRAGRRITLLRVRHYANSGTAHHLYLSDIDGNVQRTLRLERHRGGWMLKYTRARKREQHARA